MTTPDKTFPENEGLKDANRELLREMIMAVAWATIDAYREINDEGACSACELYPDGVCPQCIEIATIATNRQFAAIEAKGIADLLPVLRNYCHHMWVEIDTALVCGDCGQIDATS